MDRRFSSYLPYVSQYYSVSVRGRSKEFVEVTRFLAELHCSFGSKGLLIGTDWNGCFPIHMLKLEKLVFEVMTFE